MVANRIKNNLVLLICLAIMSLTIFPFMGCGGSGGGGGNTNNSAPVQDPVPAPQPPADINVSNTRIEFGDVVVDSYSEETISIQNAGSSNLIIGQIAQANALSAPFSIISDNCSGMQVAPSQTCTLQVRFSPTSQGGIADAFDIPSNDPIEKSVTVNVNGYGRSLKVSISEIKRDSCPKVELFISITDKNGNTISGLLPNNFTILENGVLMDITNFYEIRVPASVAMVADYSTSMLAMIPDVELASKLFIDQMNPSNSEEAAIFKFAREIYLMQEFTTDKSSLKTALDVPYPGDPNYTHLFDALWSAVDHTATRPNSRAIVLFSDGDQDYAPGSSAKTLTEVIAYAKEKGVNIFTVSFGWANTEVMSKLANETGGKYFVSPDLEHISDIYLAISKIIFGRYGVEYNSKSYGGGAVNLDLEVSYNNAQGKVSQTVVGCP